MNLVEIVVRSLARQSEEAPSCIQLLCTLSHNKEIAERISRTPSVILFLVTFINNPTCTDNVNTIFENLPKCDENAVIMAELNIMEPLIARLQEGEVESCWGVELCKIQITIVVPLCNSTFLYYDGVSW